MTLCVLIPAREGWNLAVFSLQRSAISRGACADFPAEYFRKMPLIDEPGAHADFEHAHSRIVQQLLCGFEPPAEHVLVWALTRTLLEHLGKMKNAHPRGLCQFRQADIISDLLLDSREHPVKFRARHPQVWRAASRTTGC